MKRKFIILSAISMVMFVLFAWVLGLFEQTEAKLICKTLSDAFVIVAVLDLGFGAIGFCSNQGAFRSFGYAFYTIGLLFQKSDSKIANKESYSEFCDRKTEQNKDIKHFIYVGLILLALSTMFLIIYYCI